MTRTQLTGGLSALAAFSIWGLAPIYFKAIAQAPVLEVLAHRVVWSAPLLLILIVLWRRMPALRVALRDKRTLLLLTFSTILLSVNWVIFIWAITDGRVLESSLGYYINPLMNMLLGVAVLRERLSLWQGIAVVLAVAGVLNLIFQVGAVPWVSLSLAGTFSVYGLIRKTMTLNSVEGLFAETVLLLPLALLYLIYLGVTGTGSLGAYDRMTDGLLLAAGIITALPLLAFASAARRLNYVTVGFFQYIAPTGHFLLAVFVYAEPFSQAHLVTFALIWTALAIFSFQSLRSVRRRQPCAAG